ncbi:MAG: hybrid sensor histidine kinase/response regulator [Desulfamplus sp.]|nr:hybrid sensor histidine kinase/response regulator [Desulfamplus sp.]
MQTRTAVKILIIDDDDEIRESMKGFLEDYNYKVVDAENGLQGLEYFERESPDLVLCDLIMPEVDGIEVLRTIIKKAPDIPIIIVSGTFNISDTVEALKMGAWDYISKPLLDMTILLHSIDKALQRASLIKEKELYKSRFLNKAVDAGRAQLSAMVLHNIGNAITPVAVHAAKLKNRNQSHTYRYIAQCYSDLLEHKSHLTEYITEEPRGIEVIQYMGTLIEDLQNENKKITDLINKITTGVDYVEQILTIQRSYAPDKIELKEKVNINTMIQDSLAMQELSFSAHNILLEKNLSWELPQIMIEKNKLMQVIVNLIKNSCDAIDENSDKTDHKIEITTYGTITHIGLTIKDTGIGVELERQREIFDFGISSKGSSGFGLYYCKSFVEANEGRMLLESPGRGCGSTMTIELPFTTSFM